MGDLAIGVMVGGAAGYALGKWSEKSNSKKQVQKLQAMLKKGGKDGKGKDDKKGGKHSDKSKSSHQRHHHHHGSSHGHYKPLPSMPLRQSYPMAAGYHPGRTSETTTMYSWHHPTHNYHPHYLAPASHAHGVGHGQQQQLHANPHWPHQSQQHHRDRSTAPSTYAPPPMAEQYGTSRQYT